MKKQKELGKQIGLLAVLTILVGCSNGPTSQVSISIEANTTATTLSGLPPHPSNITFNGMDISETGLVKGNGNVCYFFHVTAEDLYRERDENPRECEEPGPLPPIAGLGLVSPRAYAYGKDASLVIPAGPNRRIDLLAFMNPYYPNDPDCSRAFRIEVLGGEDRGAEILYGDYVIDPETDSNGVPQVRPGFIAHDEQIRFFAANPGISLAPGNQSITLTSIPWMLNDEEDDYEGPAGYGCEDDDGHNGPNGLAFETLPYTDYDDGLEEFIIRTGMEEVAFLKVECEGDTSTVDLNLVGSANTDTMSQVCSGGANSHVVFENINFADPGNTGDLGWRNDCPDGDDPGNAPDECIFFSLEDQNGYLIEDGRFVPSSRYYRSAHNEHNADTREDLELNLNSEFPEFLSYSRQSSTRSLFIKDKSTVPTSHIRRVDFQPSLENSGRSSFDWNYGDIRAYNIFAENFVDYAMSKIGTSLAVFGYFVSGNDYLSTLNLNPNADTFTSSDRDTGGNLWSVPSAAADNGTFVFADQSSGQIDAYRPSTIDIGTTAPQPFTISLGGNNLPSGGANVLLDMPDGETTSVIAYNEVDSPKVIFVSCDSNSDCSNQNVYTFDPTPAVVAADIVVDSSGPLLLSVVTDSSVALKRHRLDRLLGLQSLADSQLFPAPSVESHMNIKIKAMRDRSNNLLRPEVLLYFEDSAGAHIYRSRDAGASFYLVKTFMNGEIVKDITVVEHSWQDGGHDPTFALLVHEDTDEDADVDSDDAHTIYYADSHGF